MHWVKWVLLYGVPALCLAFYLGHRLYYTRVARKAINKCADAAVRSAECAVSAHYECPTGIHPAVH